MKSRKELLEEIADLTAELEAAYRVFESLRTQAQAIVDISYPASEETDDYEVVECDGCDDDDYEEEDVDCDCYDCQNTETYENSVDLEDCYCDECN